MSGVAIDDAALPVPDPETAALYRDVVSIQGERARAARRTTRTARIVAGGACLIAIAEAAVLVAVLPLKQYVPVFVYPAADGTTDTAQTLSELPPSMYVAGIESLLWQYVRKREHYSDIETPDAYTIVSAMSSTRVRQQYQDWMDPAKTPDGPPAKLGSKGTIRVKRVSAAFSQHAEDYSSGSYVIRFLRTIHEDSHTDVSQTMITTFSYVTSKTIPLWQRVNFNPGGIVVTEYPGAEQEGAPTR